VNYGEPSKGEARMTVNRPVRCGQLHFYPTANLLSPQSYSPSAPGSLSGLSSTPDE